MLSDKLREAVLRTFAKGVFPTRRDYRWRDTDGALHCCGLTAAFLDVAGNPDDHGIPHIVGTVAAHFEMNELERADFMCGWDGDPVRHSEAYELGRSLYKEVSTRLREAS
jgi:hypothetical protein